MTSSDVNKIWKNIFEQYLQFPKAIRENKTPAQKKKKTMLGNRRSTVAGIQDT